MQLQLTCEARALMDNSKTSPSKLGSSRIGGDRSQPYYSDTEPEFRACIMLLLTLTLKEVVSLLLYNRHSRISNVHALRRLPLVAMLALDRQTLRVIAFLVEHVVAEVV
jgi:hypothetical protein